MIKSMTGFGRSTLTENGRTITVEIKTVNHKYLDLNFRMPRIFNFMEHELRKEISSVLARGHADIIITYKNTREDAKDVEFDVGLMKKYSEFAKENADALCVKPDITVATLMRFPEVITVFDSDEDENALHSLAVNALREALTALVAMRDNEGRHICADLAIKLTEIERLRNAAQERAPLVAQAYESRLCERISTALSGVAYDEARLITEVAIFSDKISIDEELVRAKTHIVTMRGMLDSDAPIGRSIDFLTQELNREFNTMGSKANDAELAKLVVLAKTEIEKLREQVQNIE